MRFSTLLLFLFLGTYSLTAQTVGSTATGLASYFADEFHGSTTSYGEVYDRNKLVAAHKLFEHNALVKVTNLENGKSVRVRIIDKGPFIQGRIIEVSYRAAELLGMLGKNTARVTIELVDKADEDQGDSKVASRTRSSKEEPKITPPPPPVREERETRRTTPPPSQPEPRVTTPAPRTYEQVVTPPTPSPDRAAAPRPSNQAKKPTTFRPTDTDPITSGKFGEGTYKIELREPGTGNYGVQIASLTSLESAMQEVAKLQAKWFDNILVKRVNADATTVYKVILGPFTELDSAQRYAKDLLKRYKIKGFTTGLDGK